MNVHWLSNQVATNLVAGSFVLSCATSFAGGRPLSQKLENFEFTTTTPTLRVTISGALGHIGFLGSLITGNEARLRISHMDKSCVESKFARTYQCRYFYFNWTDQKLNCELQNSGRILRIDIGSMGSPKLYL